MNDTVLGKSMEEWAAEFPLIADLRQLRELSWFNPAVKPAAEALPEVGLTAEDIAQAAARLKRFAPYLAEVFPETRKNAGILESPLVAAPGMQTRLNQHFGAELPGQLWAKLDSHLPVSGSIKARGGIYEVLQHAESLALRVGFITVDDDYRKLNTPEAKYLFSQYKVAVGSTGNLGLSIGIMSAQLGFRASVHMSTGARQWKKDRLRSHGINVFECESDYSGCW